jgi:hypothetical protein
MQEKLHILPLKLHINAVDILLNPATIQYRTPILSSPQPFARTIEERPPMPDTPPTRPRRRRGAPLRNLNALKHGFYARKYRLTDLEDLADCKFTGLKEEMTMLRVFMRGVIEQCGATPSGAGSLEESIEVLRVLSVAAASLTRMARTQKYLDGSGQTLEGLSEILAKVQKEQGWDVAQK